VGSDAGRQEKDAFGNGTDLFGTCSTICALFMSPKSSSRVQQFSSFVLPSAFDQLKLKRKALCKEADKKRTTFIKSPDQQMY